MVVKSARAEFHRAQREGGGLSDGRGDAGPQWLLGGRGPRVFDSPFLLGNSEETEAASRAILQADVAEII